MTSDYGVHHTEIAIENFYCEFTMDCMTLGQRVRDLRRDRKLTQTELAEAVGLDQSTISDIERNKNFTAAKLAPAHGA